LVERNAVNLLFQLLKLNLIEYSRLSESQSFEPLAKKCIANRRPAGLLQFDNVFLGALLCFNPQVFKASQEFALGIDKFGSKDLSADLDGFICVIVAATDLAALDQQPVRIVVLQFM